MGKIGDFFKGAVGWVVSSVVSFFTATADAVTGKFPTKEEIELKGSKYADEKRMPDFDEVVEIHSSPWISKAVEPLQRVYDTFYKPAYNVFDNTFFKSPDITPEAAVAISAGLIPLGVGATIGASALDAAVEGISGAQGVGTGFGKIEAIRALDAKLWARLGLGAATAVALEAPVNVGLRRNLDYFYNKKFKSQKLALPQAYDAVRYREFLTESEWSAFEGDVSLAKPIEEMTPEEISAWASKAAKAVFAVEKTNSERFRAAMEWLGYKDDDIALQNRAAKHAPSLMMLRQMAMRGFFDAKFMARSIFKGGFDDWAVEPMLNFLAYMAQEGTWTGYRDAAQSAFRKGLIDEEELRSILERIHVPAMLIDPTIETQKLMMGHAKKELTTTQLLTMYSKGVITRQECLVELKGIGYTELLADNLIKTKEGEIKPSVRLPTLAQFSRAFREGIITEEDFKAYLESRGYEAKYVDMLLRIEKAKFPVIKPMMSMSSLGRAFSEGIISAVVLKQKLKELGYSDEEALWIQDLYTTGTKIPTANLSKAEILKAMKLGIIDVYNAVERLTLMGYSMDDIEILYKLTMGVAELPAE